MRKKNKPTADFSGNRSFPFRTSPPVLMIRGFMKVLNIIVLLMNITLLIIHVNRGSVPLAVISFIGCFFGLCAITYGE